MSQLITRYLVKNGCILESEEPFKLKSGNVSRFYVDVRSLISDPDAFNLVTKILTIELRGCKFDLLAGVPHGAEPYVAVVSNALGIPMVKIRKEVKEYGLCKMIEGKYHNGQECVLLEDVTSTGESVVETVRKMESLGLRVVKVVSIVDRCFGASERVRDELGVELVSMIKLSEVSLGKIVRSPVYRLYDIMKRKGSKLCLSADYIDSDSLLRIIDLVGDSIVILKTHVDMLEDLDDIVLDKLVELKKKYNFLVMEDRKYGDISKTVVRQIRNGFLNILNWADMVTIHGFLGEETLMAVMSDLEETDLGFVVINEMSNKGSLYDDSVDKFSSVLLHNGMQVVGMVGERRVKHTLMMKAGISLSGVTTVNDQTYKNPGLVDTDVWIVGSDICCNDDPIERVNEYNRIANRGNMKYEI